MALSACSSGLIAFVHFEELSRSIDSALIDYLLDILRRGLPRGPINLRGRLVLPVLLQVEICLEILL